MTVGESDGQSATDLVIIVSPASGGIETLSALISTLPTNPSAPIILAQPLDSDRQTTLAVMLQRYSPLKVEAAQKTQALTPGTLVIASSQHPLHIEPQRIVFDTTQDDTPVSVETLITSAADVYGERLIVVILAGAEDTPGIMTIKTVGGTVIVQRSRSLRSAPPAFPNEMVDGEVTTEELGTLLHDILNGMSLPQARDSNEDVLQRILEQVSYQANINFRPYKTSTILRRIGRRMAVTHNPTIRDYADYLDLHTEEVSELVKAFLINVTQFFRDPDAFAYLRDDVLPRLIARARDNDRILRLWSAGCATGEEPYSLAMLLTDMLGAELPEWNIKIFATDADERAVDFARHGLYAETLLRGLPGDFRERFFEITDQGYRIAKTLRQLVIFGNQDLGRSAPFPRIDLVLCRNVMIYFTPELQDYILNQFAFALSPNEGYLFLGKAETVRPTQSYYELVNKQWKVYRCTGNALPVMRRQNFVVPEGLRLDRSSYLRSARGGGKPTPDPESLPQPLELGQIRRFNELLLRFLPIGVVVINRQYHIVTANGPAQRLLGLREVREEQDFLHAVRGIPYTEVRSSIDNVFRERKMIALSEVELNADNGGNGHFLTLSVAPMQVDVGMPDLVVLNITDVTEQVQIRQRLEAAQAEQAHLVAELGNANHRLNDLNKELTDANEEFQIANEELVLTHEELQATIEEFETTNEELQATNEELETNNEELQATNEELQTTNDELRARTTELQDVTSLFDDERAYFADVVARSPNYVMALRGSELRVVGLTRLFAAVLHNTPARNQPLAELAVMSAAPDELHMLLDTTREVYASRKGRTAVPLRLSAGTEDGALVTFFECEIMPSVDARGNVRGVIIYAVPVQNDQRS